MSVNARSSAARGGSPGPALAAAGAALLLISLFLDWYEPGLSAWRVFEVWDLVLAALSLVTLADAAARLELPAGHRQGDNWLLLAGGGGLVIVVAALLNHPPAAVGRAPMIGLWLALVAALMMLAGGLVATARVSVAIEVDRAPRPAERGAGGRAPESAGSGGSASGGAASPGAPSGEAPTAVTAPAPRPAPLDDEA